MLKESYWKNYVEHFPELGNLPVEGVARVAAQNKTNYVLSSFFGDIEGIIRGKLLSSAKVDSDYPKVGDFVVISKLQGEQKAVIESIVPRRNTIQRLHEKNNETQVIATNIDIMFIVQGLDDNYDLRRLERYILTAKESKCRPVIILNKADLVADAEVKVAEVQQLAPEALVVAVSTQTGKGMDELRSLITPGITMVFTGSSGVGKSTLINLLVGKEDQKTQEVRITDSKGRHTTTRRELVILENGAALIDTPGMRELGVLASEENVSKTFEDIEALAAQCEFGNCDHIKSNGCAVLAALKRGEITNARYHSFLKLQREVNVIDYKKPVVEIVKEKPKAKKIPRGFMKSLNDKND